MGWREEDGKEESKVAGVARDAKDHVVLTSQCGFCGFKAVHTAVKGFQEFRSGAGTIINEVNELFPFQRNDNCLRCTE